MKPLMTMKVLPSLECKEYCYNLLYSNMKFIFCTNMCLEINVGIGILTIFAHVACNFVDIHCSRSREEHLKLILEMALYL